jgi:hypothetical protein
MTKLDEYRKIRTEGTALCTKLFGQLSRTEFNNAGRLLGILHKNTLIFDEDGTNGTEISHFSDFSIYDYYNAEKLNTVQRYWQQHGEQLPEIERCILQAQLKSQSSLFAVIDSDPQEATITLQNLFDDNHQVVVTDISMSQSPQIKEYLIFTRILPFDSFNMTSGISFIFFKDDEDLLRKKYNALFKKTFAHTPQAKNFIIFLKLSHKFGVPVLHQQL